MANPMLVPAAALVVWTLAMTVWMAVTFGPAVSKVAPRLKIGARASDLEGAVPERVLWKIHNYEHLLEQPTIFYVSVFLLAWGGYTRADLLLAWSYVAVRVLHSLWESMVNRQPVRAALFLLSTALLIPLGVRALLAVI